MRSDSTLVTAEGANADLMLAYTRPTQFVELKTPVDDIGQISGTVLLRAQELGSQVDHLRVARIAKVDLDDTPGFETVVQASSWPPPGSTDKGRPLDFVGIFVFSETGQPLGEKFDLKGREDQESRFSRELIAVAKNPFDEGWDFLMEEEYVNNRDEAADEDETLEGTEASDSRPAETFYRSVGVWRYLAGEFDFQRKMHWIQSTCTGTGCDE